MHFVLSVLVAPGPLPLYSRWGGTRTLYSRWGNTRTLYSRWGGTRTLYLRWGGTITFYLRWAGTGTFYLRWGSTITFYLRWGGTKSFCNVLLWKKRVQINKYQRPFNCSQTTLVTFRIHRYWEPLARSLVTAPLQMSLKMQSTNYDGKLEFVLNSQGQIRED